MISVYLVLPLFLRQFEVCILVRVSYIRMLEDFCPVLGFDEIVDKL
jgi:hypothetical protein